MENANFKSWLKSRLLDLYRLKSVHINWKVGYIIKVSLERDYENQFNCGRKENWRSIVLH